VPDSATPSAQGSVATARKPKRHFDLAETDAAATASARDDAPSVIRATAKPAAAAPEVAPAAPVTPAVVARIPGAMIPRGSATSPSGSTSDTAEGTAECTAEGTA